MKKDKIIVICEGSSDASFIRRFLKKRGYAPRDIDVCPYPSGEGCGEQFVRKNYPEQLRELRRWKNRGLIVMLDADTATISLRKQQLEEACRASNVSARTKSDPVLFVIPVRNSETWYKYLIGESFSELETKAQKKSNNHELAKAAAERLHDFCYREQKIPVPAPASLQETCEEWHTFLA
jgi:hypothetical protein